MSTFVVTRYVSGATRIEVFDQNAQPLADTVIELSLKETETSPARSDEVYVMDQVNKSFQPHVLVVPQNSLVAFPNSDDIRHHVYSFSKPKKFELKLYAGKPKEPIRFDNPGIVILGCNIHDSMVGYIYVYNENLVVKTDKNGQVELSTEPGNISSLTLWHPRASQGIAHRNVIAEDQLSFKNGSIRLSLTVNAPELGDSFEDVFSPADSTRH